MQQIRQFKISFTNKYIRHDVNQGKGAAIHTGIAIATSEYLLACGMPVPNTTRASTIYFLKPVVPGPADVVYGSRSMGGHPHRTLFFWHNQFQTDYSTTKFKS